MKPCKKESTMTTTNNEANPETMMIKKDHHWKIQYARFFNFPISHSSTPINYPFLRPIGLKKKRRVKGTWLSSSSTQFSLHILVFDDSFPGPTLLVSFAQKIYEEHCLSKLRFTWPQGSYASQCSLKESRVMFASYRDDSNQIQKFALRFSSSAELNNFVEVVKSLKDGRNCSNVASQCVFTERVDHEEHCASRRPSISEEHNSYLSSKLAVHNFACEGEDVALPQSFSALLSDFCTLTDLGVPQVKSDADPKQLLGTKRVADNILDFIDISDAVIIGLGGDLAI